MPTHAIVRANQPELIAYYQKKTIINNAGIKALPSVPIELIPAPGVGKIIVVQGAFFILDNTAGGYTGVTNAAWQIFAQGYKQLSGLCLMSYLLSITNSGSTGRFNFPPLIPGAGGFSTTIVSDPADGLVTITDLENSPIFIAESGYAYVGGDYGGGNAANTLEVTVFYSIVDL